jgi:hypothetical protein
MMNVAVRQLKQTAKNIINFALNSRLETLNLELTHG